MSTHWDMLAPVTRAAILADPEAVRVRAYLEAEPIEPGPHNPSHALVWACYQRAVHAGVGRTRAVKEAAVELRIHPDTVWKLLRRFGH